MGAVPLSGRSQELSLGGLAGCRCGVDKFVLYDPQ